MKFGQVLQSRTMEMSYLTVTAGRTVVDRIENKEIRKSLGMVRDRRGG